MAEPTLMKDGSIETWEDPNRLKISKPSFQNVKNNLKQIGTQAAITLNKVRNSIPKPPEQLVKGLDWAYQNSPYGLADQGAQLLGDDVSRYLINKGAPKWVGGTTALAIGLAAPGFGPAKGIKGLDKARKIAIKANRANKGFNFFPPNQTLQPAYAGAGGSPNLKIGGNKVNNPLMIKGGDAAKNVFPSKNPFPEDKTLSRLYREIDRGWKPKKGEKIYKGNNYLGDARKLRKQGKSATEVSEILGVQVRDVDGIKDVQRLRGSASAKDPLGMKPQSQLEGTTTEIRRRIKEVEQTPLGQPGFSTDSKAVKAIRETYGVKLNKHHGTGLQQIDFLYDDISPSQAKKLTKYIFEELHEPIGSIAANRMTIADAKVHRPLHNWMRKEVIGLEKTADPTNIQIDLKRYFGVRSLKHLPLKTRKRAAQIYFEHIAPASKEQLFALQQQFIKGK